MCCRRLELLEVVDPPALSVVAILLQLRPARLEQILEIARLPAAHLERARAARVERAAERRGRGGGHLPPGGGARPEPARGRVRGRAAKGPRVRVVWGL